MTHIFFVGDVHLDPNIKSREDSFCRFLDYVGARKPDKLYLMGDIFEFWFGYKTVMFAQPIRVVSRIYFLVSQGIEVTYITGNHDFNPGPVFESYLGLKIKHEPDVIALDDQKVYLSHGDEINRKDWGYRFLKSILRNKLAQKLFRLIPASLAWWIGLKTSHTSRKVTMQKKGIPEKIYREFLFNRIQEDVAVVIHGHTHKPGDEVFDINGRKIRVINSGHWLGPYYYVEYYNKEFTLKTWEE